MFVMRSWVIVIFIIGSILAGCDRPFHYSPFESNISESVRGTTRKNLQRLAASDTSANGNFKVALISDSHYHYNDLRDALTHIDSRKDIAFIIVTGDFTENGLQKEFELFFDIMNHSRLPYLTVIGNHDYLSNGGAVYSQLYGDYNYSFTFSGVQFIAFDNIIWEDPKEPDFEWLSQVLTGNADHGGRQDVRHKIVLSHIPPFDGQMEQTRERFHEILVSNDVKVSIHGHKHEYWAGYFFDERVTYMTVGSPSKRAYAELNIMGDSLSVQKVEF